MTTTHPDERLAAQERELALLRAEIAKWRALYVKQPLRTDTDFSTISEAVSGVSTRTVSL